MTIFYIFKDNTIRVFILPIIYDRGVRDVSELPEEMKNSVVFVEII